MRGVYTYIYLGVVDADDSDKIYDDQNAKFYRCQRNINYTDPKQEGHLIARPNEKGGEKGGSPFLTISRGLRVRCMRGIC